MRNFSKWTLMACSLLVACGGTEDDDGDLPGKIELVGLYASNFGFSEAITETKWGTATIVEFDNAMNFAITQQPADDQFNPSKFSKIVWTEPANGFFWYCTVEFGKDTADDAKGTTMTADSTDPANGGCGGFSWTRLGPDIEIAGSYTSSFGGDETISAGMWGTSFVREYDNDTNVVYLQLPPDDMFNPDKYNKVVYTEPDTGGAFYYCWVDFGLDTLTAAKTSTQTWDDSDPDNAGCGGFSWTKLTPN